MQGATRQTLHTWSPAPCSSGVARSTPMAMSWDCLPMQLITAHVLPSKPSSELLKPMSHTTFLQPREKEERALVILTGRGHYEAFSPIRVRPYKHQ